MRKKPLGSKSPSSTKRFLIALLLIFGILFQVTPPTQAETPRLLYSIFIPFQVGGIVSVRFPDGSEQSIGQVGLLPEKTRWPAYTASRWGTPGTVAASAVNAIHLLIDIEKGRGRTLSLLPSETVAPAAGPGSALVVEGKGGYGLFGGWAPPVGAPVTVISASGEERPLNGGLLPKEGEVLRIDVNSLCSPYMIEIENRPGGRVFSWSRSVEQSGVIARVLRPVRGVGRFEGTLFQSVGRLRANHPGVIDISTSPEGTIGGFQIIPFNHAHSAEMEGAWQKTQWLIIDSADGKTPLTGRPPLFGGILVPGPRETEQLWDLWSTYGRRPLILCRIEGGPWTGLPEAIGKQDNALERVTHLRLYFPVVEEPNL
ncbi:MAG: hypothetical protein GX436_06890 [Synergistaceae bacterium]|nr:hypothetical protein [Synergistaceae bacterium]